MWCLWWFGKHILHVAVIISLGHQTLLLGSRSRLASIRRHDCIVGLVSPSESTGETSGRSSGPTVNSQDFRDDMVRHRQGAPAWGSQGTAVGKQPHWTGGSQGTWGMSRIKLPAVEEMVMFGSLLNEVCWRGEPAILWLSNTPGVVPLLAPLACSSSSHS